MLKAGRTTGRRTQADPQSSRQRKGNVPESLLKEEYRVDLKDSHYHFAPWLLNGEIRTEVVVVFVWFLLLD